MQHKVILLGDSTCAHKPEESRPETGWGEKFGKYLRESWVIDNRAITGLSTKDCISLGVFDHALEDAIEGDLAFIQFGHNDSKQDEARHTSPWTSYLLNLVYMAERLKEKGVRPIFLTSIARRFFVDGVVRDTHGEYPSAMKAAAHQTGCSVLDITLPTMLSLQAMGENESRKLFMNFDAGEYPNFPEGKEDNTHLRPEGAEWIARIIYGEICTLTDKPEAVL